VRAASPAFSAPILVHCSAGIGRTGVFCVLDAATRALLAAGRAGGGGAAALQAAAAARGVEALVESLRRQRAGMVQTPAQYVLCYDALLRFASGALRLRARGPAAREVLALRGADGHRLFKDFPQRDSRGRKWGRDSDRAEATAAVRRAAPAK
jgi:hypothetical protein